MKSNEPDWLYNTLLTMKLIEIADLQAKHLDYDGYLIAKLLGYRKSVPSKYAKLAKKYHWIIP